jgi:SAM-dependent methyltransferase
MKILNLGCGTKISLSPEVINVDWSIYLQMRKNPILRTAAPLLLRGERLDLFHSLSDQVMVHDLAKGIPFPSESVDVVFHSHFLEHLDRTVAGKFLLEVKRVLKPGGIQRIVVPDFETSCKSYLSHLSICETSAEEAERHDAYIAGILEQSVRREAFSTSQQKPLRRFMENLLLGDARRRGETHQWMYDRISLRTLLIKLGFKIPIRQSYNTSLVPNWERYGLDLDERCMEYKPGSLYMEVQR